MASLMVVIRKNTFSKINLSSGFKRFCSTVAIKKRSKTADSTNKKAQDSNKINVTSRNKKLLTYLSSNDDLKQTISKVSPYLLKVHQCNPESLYLVAKPTAKYIVKYIGDKLKTDCPIVEVNPGFGCLTKELLEFGVDHLNLYEVSSYYENSIKKLQEEYPGKIDYYNEDFLAMGKFAFQDRMDSGSRVDSLLKGIKVVPWEDIGVQIIGALPSILFINHLIQSIVFHTDIVSMGRPELFIVLPPSCYHSLIPQENFENEYFLHRPTAVLFNILFDSCFLTKVPRADFLPWQSEEKSGKKKSAPKKLAGIDSEYLYLIHCVVKKDLPCKSEHLPLLWFFFKQHLLNRNNRIIPILEQWIPGCGVWLITGQNPPGTNMELAPNEHDAPLPHMTIFTNFKDLTAAQKLTVFKRFISWPEFENSTFLEAMESHRIRSYTNSMDIKDDILVEQEDEVSEISPYNE